MNFWTKTAGLILRNRYLVLLLVALFTAFLTTQFKHIKFSYTEANLLPENHEANIQYNQFLEIFGEEGLVLLNMDEVILRSEELRKKDYKKPFLICSKNSPSYLYKPANRQFFA